MIKCWIEAARPRTLPVSLAGVVLASGLNLLGGTFRAAPALLCFAVALFAQVASNFANEYFDFKSGLDRKGREGPRRGVTEGDISPRAMLIATYVALGLALVAGLALAACCGWWLIAVGALIAVGVVAYSAGPYPLSRHGLGEVAVLLFFGVIPVNFTYYVQALAWSPYVLMASVSAGLMAANVLIVNNYRDLEDDRAVGKRTLAVIWGRKQTSALYLFNGYWGIVFMLPLWLTLPTVTWLVPLSYIALHTVLWNRISSLRGRALNRYLGLTSVAMFAYSLLTAVALALV